MKPGQSSQFVSIILLLLVIVGVFVFVFPMRGKIVELKADRLVLDGELTALNAEYDSLSALSLETAKSEATKEALLKAVPVNTAQDELILELSKIAEDNGFDLNAVNFSESSDAVLGNFVSTNVNVTGNSDKLITLLQQFESADRLITVKSLSIQRTSSTAISANISLDAYYQ